MVRKGLSDASFSPASHTEAWRAAYTASLLSQALHAREFTGICEGGFPALPDLGRIPGAGGRRRSAGVVFKQVSDQDLPFPPPFSSHLGWALIH